MPLERPNANRLIDATSPYLLQHAHNPVDWYPWGDEALQRARQLDRPILLSIGYAACHWCHVMERESFENDGIAALMNEHFVCIKVDREERPDLDDIYMQATMAISGSGGWPMTVFLTPEQQPFFAGTYFPPDRRSGRPSFPDLLQHIAKAWREERRELLTQAEQLTQHLQAGARAPAAQGVNLVATQRAVQQLLATFDERWGGFGGAPKFPPYGALGLLLRHAEENGDQVALGAVTTTLDAMKNGGLYDHLAGGFARYATDERWLVPHFEKMLYDNAQMVRAYLEAYQVSGDAEYQRIVLETTAYVQREMQAPTGGYFSSTDADSEGEEGKFFVFHRDEIDAILGSDAADVFCTAYGVTPAGNWEEGKNILHTPQPLPAVAAQLGSSEAALQNELSVSRTRMLQARQQRQPPLLDDKILASWNGLMIGAMANVALTLDHATALHSAVRAADFVLDRMRTEEGRLHHAARHDRAQGPGFLEDYAYLGDGLLDLYEASGEERFRQAALAFAERILSDFTAAGRGEFFSTADDHETLLLRPTEGYDGATPSANAVAARLLARLSYHFDRGDLRQRASDALDAYGMLIARSPQAFPTSLAVAELLQRPPIELVLLGRFDDPRYQALLRAAARPYLPRRILLHHDPAHSPGGTHPLIAGKTMIEGQPTAYLCHGFRCEAPLSQAAELTQALAKISSNAKPG